MINAIGTLYKSVAAQKNMEIKGKKTQIIYNLTSQIQPQLAFTFLNAILMHILYLYIHIKYIYIY